MKRLLILALGALIALTIACGDSDNPTKPIDGDNDPDTSPLFSVTVVDTDGNPVPDIRVGTFNRSPYDPWPQPWAALVAPLQFLPHVWRIDYPAAGRVVVTVEDYYRRLIDTIFDDSVEAGSDWLSWTPIGTDTIVPGGYYHMMVDKPISATERATQDIVVVFDWQFNPIFTVHGVTDSTGTFTTNDTLLFPALLGNPPPYLPDPDLAGDTILPFYSDSLVIHLSDPDDLYDLLYFPVKLSSGPNAFQLVWNPAE